VILTYIITALVAYLLGSIPTGYLAGRAKGLDLRTVGSGNIGATNAFRILGKGPGIFVLLVDALKGWVAVAWAGVLAYKMVHGGAQPDDKTLLYLRIVAGICAILGHNYTCWLKFKGGKGIATSAGVLAGLIPMAFLAVLVTWIVVCVLTRYVSAASIAAAAVLPFATWLLGYGGLLIGITAFLGALAIYKHKGNIERLRKGTENKIGGKKKTTT
jgi:acyl phosphate:glycerol-3-phosphate acyltransferase